MAKEKEAWFSSTEHKRANREKKDYCIYVGRGVARAKGATVGRTTTIYHPVTSVITVGVLHKNY